MRRYNVKIGNMVERRGHRHDCAQVEVTIGVMARDASHAEMVVRHLVESKPRLHTVFEGHEVIVDFNHATIAKTMRVYEDKS